MSFKDGFIFKTAEFNHNSIFANRLERESNFEIVERLGHGSFGSVYKVTHMSSNEK